MDDVDSASMRHLLEAEPFLTYMGLEMFEARSGRAVLHLQRRADVTNHMASIHGGAQYALGEATAIALAATLFLDRISQVDILTASACVTYHHPAHGSLTARAELPDAECERIRAVFDAQGRARILVNVTLVDAGGADATTLAVECVARLRPQASLVRASDGSPF